MYSIERTNQFKRDYKRIKKRNYDLAKLEKVISILLNGESLPENYKPHPLSGNYKNTMECHITGNWLLIYTINVREQILILIRTGTHADLFE